MGKMVHVFNEILVHANSFFMVIVTFRLSNFNAQWTLDLVGQQRRLPVQVI